MRKRCWLAVLGVSPSCCSAQSASSSAGLTAITGSSELATPTGSYITYTSTRFASSTPITSIPIVSTVRGSGSDGASSTTVVGYSTIYSYLIGNDTLRTASSSSSSSSSNSQTYLQGSTRSSAVNGTQTSTAAVPVNTQPCNNYVDFCYRSYGNITEVSAHNSPFVRAGNAASNQALPVRTQLDDGIRQLQGQVHFIDGTPHFCHTSCDVLDAGPISGWLGEVRDWVAGHPYDVVTILLGNGDGRPVTDYVPALEASGLVRYAYLPPRVPMALEDWPTLADMILTGKRVVFFMDYQADQARVPYVLDEFSQMWETPFSPTNRSFPCTVQRPPGLSDADATQRLYMTNHNLNYEITLLGNSLLVPTLPLLNETNAADVNVTGSLGAGAATCRAAWPRPPKFLNVDYYNVGAGSVFQVAARCNGVVYDRPCCGRVASAAAPRDIPLGPAASAWLALVVVASVFWLVL